MDFQLAQLWRNYKASPDDLAAAQSLLAAIRHAGIQEGWQPDITFLIAPLTKDQLLKQYPHPEWPDTFRVFVKHPLWTEVITSNLHDFTESTREMIWSDLQQFSLLRPHQEPDLLIETQLIGFDPETEDLFFQVDGHWEEEWAEEPEAWIDPNCGCSRSPDVSQDTPCPLHGKRYRRNAGSWNPDDPKKWIYDPYSWTRKKKSTPWKIEFCPYCGYSLAINWKHCPRCDKKIPKNPPHNMCQYCGVRVAINWKHCPKCDKQIRRANPSGLCSVCGLPFEGKYYKRHVDCGTLPTSKKKKRRKKKRRKKKKPPQKTVVLIPEAVTEGAAVDTKWCWACSSKTHNFSAKCLTKKIKPKRKKRRRKRKPNPITSEVEFREVGPSPLTYQRGGNVQRIALCDPQVTDPPHPSDTYFAHIEKWRRFSKRGGKRLKKPVLDEIIPGVDDNCIVAFLDYHKIGEDSYYIDYVKTRRDFAGQGYASAIFDYFYQTHLDASLIHFGKMMQPSIGHILEKMKKRYPDIDSIGAINYY